MKTILFISISLFFLSACKKKYNCTCSTTITYTSTSNNQDYVTSKTSPMSVKMSEKQAKDVCAHESDNIDATYRNIFNNNGTRNSSVQSVKTNCLLK